MLSCLRMPSSFPQPGAEMEDFLKVTCGDSTEPQVQENLVDMDLDQFAKFMRTKMEGDLLPMERSVIKTYLAWKLKRFRE